MRILYLSPYEIQNRIQQINAFKWSLSYVPACGIQYPAAKFLYLARLGVGDGMRLWDTELSSLIWSLSDGDTESVRYIDVGNFCVLSRS